VTAALLVLALLAQAPAPAASLPPDLAAIRTLIMAGRIDKAMSDLAALPADRPLVGYLTGLAYYHRDDHVRAIERLAPVVTRLPEGSAERREAEQVLGLSYYVAGRLQEAVPLLEATRAWAKDNMELGHVLGLTYIQTRQPDKARIAIAETFGVGAETPAAHLFTAQQMIRVEFHDAAAAELRKALALDPRLPQAHALLGQLAVHRARLEEAVALFGKSLEIDPLDAMTHYRLGEAHARRQEWDLAIAALQRSLWINPFFSGPYIVLGRAYMTKDQPAMAEGLLRRAVEYDPNNKSAHYLLGQALQKLGREADAAREFEIAEKLGDGGQSR
jgi:tetratricopeptide (TPR) repeat protein